MTNITPRPLDSTDKRPFFWDENKQREVFWPFALLWLERPRAFGPRKVTLPPHKVEEIVLSRHEVFEAAIEDNMYGKLHDILGSRIETLNKLKTDFLYPLREYDYELKSDFIHNVLSIFSLSQDILQNIYFVCSEDFVSLFLEKLKLKLKEDPGCYHFGNWVGYWRASNLKLLNEKFIIIPEPKKEQSESPKDSSVDFFKKAKQATDKIIDGFKEDGDIHTKDIENLIDTLRGNNAKKEEKRPLVEYVEKWEALKSSGKADILIELTKNLNGKIPASNEWYDVLDKWSEKHNIGQEELGDMIKSLMELLV